MDPSQLLARVKTLGGALTLTQKLTMAGAFAAVVLVVGGSALWLQQTDYALLFSDMDAEAANEVVGRLKAEKIPYELDPGGRSIRVPVSRVDELRLEFASQGMPSSGRIGFEIFDRTAFGATEFLEQVNYRRALEGEIGRTIGALSEVASARVHIAMARQSLFASKEQPAKASVVLKLRGNRQLAPATIQGITNLVASSVEGLRPEAVVVMDSYGRPLAKPPVDGDEPLGGAAMERQQRVERDLTNKVAELLEPVVGAQAVRVNVSARLDGSSAESTEEKWDPNAPVVRSRQVSGDLSAMSAAQGIAGTRANLPGTVPAASEPAAEEPPPAPRSTERLQAGRGSETTNYEISRTTTHTVRPRGELARLSVAVILDNEMVTSRAEDGTVTRSSKPRAPETLQKIQGLVAAAVGLDPARGDVLTVENVPFEETFTEDAPKQTFWQKVTPYANDSVRVVVPLVLGLVALLFVVRPLVKKLTGPPATQGPLPEVTEEPRTVRDIEGEIEAQLDAMAAEKNTNRKVPVLSRRISGLASKEPEHAARLLRMLMAEDGN